MDDFNNQNNRQDDNRELFSWIPVIILLVVFWPVGLVMLLIKLTGGSKTSHYRQRFESSGNARRSTGPYAASGAQTGAGPYAASGSAPRSSAQSAAGPYTYAPGRQSAPQGPAAAAPGPASAASNPVQNDRQRKQAPGTQGVPRGYRPPKGVNLNKGKAMTVWGAIIASVFAIGSITMIPELFYGGLEILFGALFPCLGFFCGGLALLYTGRQRTKKAKRFRKYQALIGRRESISITTLAQAMPVSIHTACDDLQDMLDDGLLPRGYLDMGSGRLIFGDGGLHEEPPKTEVAPEPVEEEPTDDQILAQIKKANDAISDPEMSRKIDRIGEITGKIFIYQRQNPGRDSQLRSFLNYYLPTTLKILNAYAQMEAQGVEGDNITATKLRIEGMMDKVVEGFEKQLDKLFANNAMDITTDVEVLERMLEKDGLSSAHGHELTLGG